VKTEDIEQYLKHVAERPPNPSAEEVATALKELKVVVLSRGEEHEAKRLWCLEQTPSKGKEDFTALMISCWASSRTCEACRTMPNRAK
jgi:hypothetical protein